MATTVELPFEIHESLERFLNENLELPMLPEAAARIIALCEGGTAGARDIQGVLERDPSLASHVLRLANSALFAPVEPVVSLQQASSRLGMTTIRNLALAVSLQGRIFCGKQHEDLTRTMWRHSALAAVFARDLARCLRKNGDAAFLCGLMHDVGRPIVLQAAIQRPDLLSSGAEGPQLLEASMDEFHARVGARLVQAWGLPYPTAAIIACHHEPEAALEHAPDARIVQLADLLAHWAVEDVLEESDFPLDDPVIAELGLTDAQMGAILASRQQALSFAMALA